MKDMQKTEKFFIFSWKELTVIGLLFLISLGFFFTLGLHYGKKLNPKIAATEPAAKLKESPEVVPPHEDLDAASRHAEAVAQDSIQAATQDEVKDSGLKVDDPKPVDLPTETVGEKAADHPEPAHTTEPAAESTAESTAEYAIQLGSYPSKKDAQLKIKSLKKRGLHPSTMTAVVQGITRYRVILPDFKTFATANQKAKELRQKRKIENYVVIKAN